MQLSEFDYDLPEDRIALYPRETRDQSRLMKLIRTTGAISHHIFADLPDLLKPSDLLVLNNTKVFPARLLGYRKGLTSEFSGKARPLRAQIEVLLVKPLGDDVWETLVKPGRKMRIGEKVCFGQGQLECEVLERGNFGVRRVRFNYRGNFDEIIDHLGHVPLPPYIARPAEPRDKAQYQTIFAQKRGAVAAPTAGLHFTQAVFERLRQRGVEWCEITLHVGLGTFQPVHSELVEEHRQTPPKPSIRPSLGAAALSPSALRSHGRWNLSHFNTMFIPWLEKVKPICSSIRDSDSAVSRA
jgi:S-adenosylmethionine:tRNA ribosyltransferase-isomerase